jgi:hypothetical protein
VWTGWLVRMRGLLYPLSPSDNLDVSVPEPMLVYINLEVLGPPQN